MLRMEHSCQFVISHTYNVIYLSSLFPPSKDIYDICAEYGAPLEEG